MKKKFIDPLRKLILSKFDYKVVDMETDDNHHIGYLNSNDVTMFVYIKSFNIYLKFEDGDIEKRKIYNVDEFERYIKLLAFE
jgi:hypothetical protein